MTAEEEGLLGELNKDIPDPVLLSIHIIDSWGTFVHNFRIPSKVSARLSATENNCLTKFCSQKNHK